MCILKRSQGLCKPNAESSFFAGAKPVLAAPFLKKRCKGTTFCAHSQIKCTKTTPMCTNLSICAIKCCTLSP